MKYIDADRLKAKIKERIEELNEQIVDLSDSKAALRIRELLRVLDLIDSLQQKSEEESDLQDAEVIFSGYALYTDATKWSNGYKLKIRIYDDN